MTFAPARYVPDHASSGIEWRTSAFEAAQARYAARRRATRAGVATAVFLIAGSAAVVVSRSGSDTPAGMLGSEQVPQSARPAPAVAAATPLPGTFVLIPPVADGGGSRPSVSAQPNPSPPTPAIARPIPNQQPSGTADPSGIDNREPTSASDRLALAGTREVSSAATVEADIDLSSAPASVSAAPPAGLSTDSGDPSATGAAFEAAFLANEPAESGAGGAAAESEPTEIALQAPGPAAEVATEEQPAPIALALAEPTASSSAIADGPLDAVKEEPAARPGNAGSADLDRVPRQAPAAPEAAPDERATAPLRLAAATPVPPPSIRLVAETSAYEQVYPTVVVNGQALGAATLRVFTSDYSAVHLGALLGLFKLRLPPDDFARFSRASVTDTFVALDDLRNAGFAVEYDRRRGQLVLGLADRGLED